MMTPIMMTIYPNITTSFKDTLLNISNEFIIFMPVVIKANVKQNTTIETIKYLYTNPVYIKSKQNHGKKSLPWF